MAKLGIYCIENWSGRRANKNSVKPVLDFLEASGVARSIHAPVSTLDELQHRIDDWAPRKQYPVGYLALHGSEENVWVGSEQLHLEDLMLLESATGSTVNLTGKTLFLASCSTLATNRRWLGNLRDQTKAGTVCGYGLDVEWFSAAAFDLLLLAALAQYRRPADAIKYLRREHPGFAQSMAFRSEPDWRPNRASRASPHAPD